MLSPEQNKCIDDLSLFIQEEQSKIPTLKGPALYKACSSIVNAVNKINAISAGLTFELENGVPFSI